jgi:hypothetical protein
MTLRAPTRRELASLFERRKHARVYPTMRAELDAVASGAKAMTLEVWPRSAIEAGDRDYEELLRLACDRGLQVMHQPDRGRTGVPIVAVYVLHAEQAWRVPAHRALWQTFSEWSDEAEALEGHLLGYSKAQIAAWLAARRHERLGWRGSTVYLVMTRAQRRIVASTGHRYLHPDAAGMTAVCCAGTHVIKQRPPAWLARSERVIARIAVAGEPVAFAGRGPVRSARLTREHAKAVNAALESRIEYLGPNGWRRA